jgi:hypothetical protein
MQSRYMRTCMSSADRGRCCTCTAANKQGIWAWPTATVPQNVASISGLASPSRTTTAALTTKSRTSPTAQAGSTTARRREDATRAHTLGRRLQRHHCRRRTAAILARTTSGTSPHRFLRMNRSSSSLWTSAVSTRDCFACLLLRAQSLIYELCQQQPAVLIIVSTLA